MIFPDESCDRIQDILKSDYTIVQKSYQIEQYYKSLTPYNRNRQNTEKVKTLSHFQIEDELLKRGDNLTPVEIEL